MPESQKLLLVAQLGILIVQIAVAFDLAPTLLAGVYWIVANL